MVLERMRGTVTAKVGDTVIASSKRAMVVREFGRHTYAPVLYFPPGDVLGERLTPVARTTECPLKGTASYFDIEGQWQVPGGAWSYQQTHDFDPRLSQLESCVAFDRALVTIEISKT